MKKRLPLILLLLLLVCVAVWPSNGQTDSVNALSAGDNGQTFTAAEMKNELLSFVEGEAGESGARKGERRDRTSFTDAEVKAADYLVERMSGLNSFSTERQSFKYQPYKNLPDEFYQSQNVISVYKSAAQNPRAVVIGANYDNQFGDFKTSSHTVLTATGSNGAYLNGTGVATLLQLAEKIDGLKPQLAFDLYIVFFGAGEMWNYGAERFVAEYVSASLLSDTMLMINLQHIGGDKTYIYSDEVETDHNRYLFDKAGELGLDFSGVPASLPRMPAVYLDSLGYTHLGMLGDSSAFANRGVPYANIFGGTFDTFQLGLNEQKGRKDVRYTPNDNAAFLDEHMNNYSYRMSETALLLLETLTAEDFVAAVGASRETAYDYGWLMRGWIPAVVLIGIILLSALLLVLLVRRFEKKYPYTPQIKRLKIAVFGMDYEEKNDTDIFIDLKSGPPSDNRNPFDGY